MATKKLSKLRDQLESKTPFIGNSLRQRALDELVRDGSPEAVELITDAVIAGESESVRLAAFDGLAALARFRVLAAQEAISRLYITHPHLFGPRPEFITEYAPQDAVQRAVYLFLSEQWDRYLAFDPKHQMLADGYAQALPHVRQRLALHARRHGSVAWLAVMAGMRQAGRLAEMTDIEWEATLALLDLWSAGEEMWQLAQAAPAKWSVPLLQRLKVTEWRPTTQREQHAFTEFARLAAGCVGAPPDYEKIRMRASLGGHIGRVSALLVAPDNETLASGGLDTKVRIWRLSDGLALRTLPGHTSEVSALAFSHDGQLLASSSLEDRSVRVWGMSGGQPLKKLNGQHAWNYALGFRDSKDLVISHPYPGAVRYWCFPSGLEPTVLDTFNTVTTAVAISQDGVMLVAGSRNGILRIWHLLSNRLLFTLTGSSDEVTHLATTPNGQGLVTAGRHTTIQVWQLPGKTPKHTIPVPQTPTTALAISTDGGMVARGGQDGTIRLCRLGSGPGAQTLQADEHPVSALTFSPTGHLLVSGSADGTIRLWGLKSFRLGDDPQAQSGPLLLAKIEAAMEDGGVSYAEWRWLRFHLALRRWQQGFTTL